MQWPFKDMQVGDVAVFCYKSQQYYVRQIPGIENVRIVFLDNWVPMTRSATTAHAYARVKGWRFKTKTHKLEDGTNVTIIKRVKGTHDAIKQKVRRWQDYGYESLAIGESITYDDPAMIYHVMNTMQYRAKVLGVIYQRNSDYDPQAGSYKALTVKRIR